MSYNIKLKHCIKTLLSLAFASYASSALSYTVEDAIVNAHIHNNKILAQFEQLNADKTTRWQAYAGFMPTATASVTSSHTKYRLGVVEQNNSNPNSRVNNINISQPIFNGGATYAAIKIAENTISGSIERFKNVSSAVIVEVVSAYEGVLSAREIYDINVKNQEVFEKYLEFTKIRFDAGVVTKTDVLQADYRLADAIAQREKAYSDMRNAEAKFERVVGIPVPNDLETIITDHISLPESVEDIIEAANKFNPYLQSAKFDSEVAKNQVTTAYSRLLPTVSAGASMKRSHDPKSLAYNSDNKTYYMQVQVPIFQSGSEYATISQFKAASRKAEYDKHEADRLTTETAINAWNLFKTAKAVINSRENGIRAASEALEGVKEEVKVGTRTTIDLLNAEKDLFDARVAQRSAKRDYVTSVYQILQVMGVIETPDPDYIAEKISG